MKNIEKEHLIIKIKKMNKKNIKEKRKEKNVTVSFRPVRNIKESFEVIEFILNLKNQKEFNK